MVYNPFADTSVYLGTLQLPHVTNVSVNSEWEQTELPIERGAVISDHRRKRPVMITINGYVTGQIQTTPDSAGQLLGSAATRVAIETLAETGTTFTVIWNKRRWPNMSIVTFDEDHSAERRDDMFAFALSLKQTRVATSTMVAAAPVDPTIADLTSAPLDGGPQSGTAVGPEMGADVTGIIGGGV